MRDYWCGRQGTVPSAWFWGQQFKLTEPTSRPRPVHFSSRRSVNKNLTDSMLLPSHEDGPVQPRLNPGSNNPGSGWAGAGVGNSTCLLCSNTLGISGPVQRSWISPDIWNKIEAWIRSVTPHGRRSQHHTSHGGHLCWQGVTKAPRPAKDLSRVQQLLQIMTLLWPTLGARRQSSWRLHQRNGALTQRRVRSGQICPSSPPQACSIFPCFSGNL